MSTPPETRPLEALIEETASTHHPILLHGEHHDAVLLSRGDWDNITATLRLLSSPPIQESLRKAMEEDEQPRT